MSHMMGKGSDFSAHTFTCQTSYIVQPLVRSIVLPLHYLPVLTHSTEVAHRYFSASLLVGMIASTELKALCVCVCVCVIPV